MRPVPGRRAPGRASISHRARPGDVTLAPDEAKKEATAYGHLPLRSVRPEFSLFPFQGKGARFARETSAYPRAEGARQWVEHASTRHCLFGGVEQTQGLLTGAGGLPTAPVRSPCSQSCMITAGPLTCGGPSKPTPP